MTLEKIPLGVQFPLKDAFERVNDIIDAADKASTDSTTAKTKAEEALANSESTQTQLDTIVINGDSSVEAAQARVDSEGVAHTTLKKRLDTEHNNVTAHLEQSEGKLKNVTLDVEKDFDIDPLNASTGLQNAVNFARINQYQRIILPNNQYEFDTPIMIDFDNLEIDFQGSTVKWNGTADLGESNGIHRDYGFLNVWGKKELELPGLLAFDPLLILDDTANNKTSYVGALEFSASQVINAPAGSFIELDITTGEYGMYIGMSDYKPCAQILCRVVGYNETNPNIMYIEYTSPFDWEGIPLKTTRVYKVEPVKTIKISNFNYEDTTPKSTNSNPLPSERQSWVGGISIKYAFNVTVENVTSKGHKFPAIKVLYSHTINLKNVYASEPGSTSGGTGYGAQIRRSMYVNIENFYGNGNRHLIDFSSAAYCNVENAGQPLSGANNGVFDLHGECEHHISFKNTIGKVIAGNSWSEFPMLTSDVVLDNHTGILNIAYIENLKISNSDVLAIGNLILNNTLVTNSKFEMNPRAVITATTRGGKLKNPYFKASNSDVKVKSRNANAEEYVSFEEFNHFSLYDVNLSGESRVLDKQEFIWLRNIKNINVVGGLNLGVGLYQLGEIGGGVVRVKDVDFRFEKLSATIPPSFISIQPGSATGKFSLIIDKNVLVNEHPTVAVRWLRLAGTPQNYAIECSATITDNHFMKGIEDSFVSPSTFKWNSHGNYLGGYLNSGSGILSEGLLLVAPNKTTKRVAIDNTGAIISK